MGWTVGTKGNPKIRLHPVALAPPWAARAAAPPRRCRPPRHWRPRRRRCRRGPPPTAPRRRPGRARPRRRPRRRLRRPPGSCCTAARCPPVRVHVHVGGSGRGHVMGNSNDAVHTQTQAGDEAPRSHYPPLRPFLLPPVTQGACLRHSMSSKTCRAPYPRPPQCPATHHSLPTHTAFCPHHTNQPLPTTHRSLPSTHRVRLHA